MDADTEEAVNNDMKDLTDSAISTGELLGSLMHIFQHNKDLGPFVLIAGTSGQITLTVQDVDWMRIGILKYAKELGHAK